MRLLKDCLHEEQQKLILINEVAERMFTWRAAKTNFHKWGCWKNVFIKSSKKLLKMRLLKECLHEEQQAQKARILVHRRTWREAREVAVLFPFTTFCFSLSVFFFTTSCSPCLPPSQQTSSVSCCLSFSSPITTFFCFFLLISYFTTSSLSLPWSFLLDQPPTSSSPPPPINIKSQIFWLCPVWKIFKNIQNVSKKLPHIYQGSNMRPFHLHHH